MPVLPLVPRFARKAAQLEPAVALNGNASGVEALKWVSAAVYTAGDLVSLLRINTTGTGQGLRGGKFRIAHRGESVRITLDHVRWTEDLAVSGTIDKPEDRAGAVRARLALEDSQGPAGRLTIQWQESGPEAHALVRGTIGGAAVVAQTPVP